MKQIQIIGNIGQDATIKGSNGSNFVSFTVAVNERYKDKNGNEIEKTDWYSCISKQMALADYLKSGTKVYVQGNFKLTSYQNSNKEWCAGLNISATNIELLSRKKEEQPS